ncbi:polysaccharide biosynthesis C-terminal domain-containing protein [Lactobacillus sp. ESL0791]|uniref:oligosaccharide flippase family protein n=1 Tax=Lactobacillus sp. ESL0791 TaxID=2983234 RepID=UPI0023F832E0|nr:polysaccharide biosynthesis C-terminal domain-containing protein [Lactobacillus sp. ESL0791]MDF7639822.1 polysaccharide biosynthesis C-terminal domain-containing protein [Lactobacillus sp. ESL0791]
MKVVKNYLYNIIYQIFIVLVPLITTPYIAQVVGPTGVGINSFTTAIMQYFILLGSIGINLYAERQIAFVRDKHKLVTQTFYEILFLKIFTTVGSFLLFLLFLFLIQQYQIYYWAQSFLLIASALDISWLFMGVENFSVTVIRNFIVKILTIVSIFVFVKSPADLVRYILISSVSVLIGNLTMFPSLKRYVGRPDFKSLAIWQHLKPALALFIPQVASQIYWVLNKTMLGSLKSVQAAGYFDQSDKIVKMLLGIVTATGTVMLPHVANAFANKNYRKTKEYLYKSFSFVSAIAVPMTLGLLVVAGKLIPLFLTMQFIDVIPIMMVESFVILPIAWSNVIGNQYLLPTNQNRNYTVSVILGAVVNVLCNIIFIIANGAVGAALATVISEAAITGYQLWGIRRQVNFHSLFYEFGKYLIAGLIMYLCVLGADHVLSTSWLMLIVEIIVGVAVYLAVLFFLRASILTVFEKWLAKLFRK